MTEKHEAVKSSTLTAEYKHLPMPAPPGKSHAL